MYSIYVTLQRFRMTIRALKTAILTLPSTSKVSDSEKQSFPKTSASPSCSDASISPSFSTPEKRKTDWRSIYISSVLTFMSAIQFSLYFSSQWPYLQKVGRTVIGLAKRTNA